MRSFRIAAALLPLALLAGCAHSPSYDPSDPLEPVNRAVYAFNETADRFVLRPVAKGYDAVTPRPVRTGVRNFFSNLFYPTVLVNDLLQGKGAQFGQDLARLFLNSTAGLFGFMDVATPNGLPKHDEDFGQTLGYWGVGPGWYLMLPLLGPATNRDLVGRAGDYGTNPLVYFDNEGVSWGLGVLDTVETRAQFLPLDKVLEQQLDRYVFIRTGYLQDRLNKVHDGNPPKEDPGFEEEEDSESAPAEDAE
jgi:phospholipid-binding lipoprotein MlaA